MNKSNFLQNRHNLKTLRLVKFQLSVLVIRSQKLLT